MISGLFSVTYMQTQKIARSLGQTQYQPSHKSDMPSTASPWGPDSFQWFNDPNKEIQRAPQNQLQASAWQARNQKIRIGKFVKVVYPERVIWKKDTMKYENGMNSFKKVVKRLHNI